MDSEGGDLGPPCKKAKYADGCDPLAKEDTEAKSSSPQEGEGREGVSSSECVRVEEEEVSDVNTAGVEAEKTAALQARHSDSQPCTAETENSEARMSESQPRTAGVETHRHCTDSTTELQPPTEEDELIAKVWLVILCAV